MAMTDSELRDLMWLAEAQRRDRDGDNPCGRCKKGYSTHCVCAQAIFKGELSGAAVVLFRAEQLYQLKRLLQDMTERQRLERVDLKKEILRWDLHQYYNCDRFNADFVKP
jgi:hypothetical protein